MAEQNHEAETPAGNIHATTHIREELANHVWNGIENAIKHANGTEQPRNTIPHGEKADPSKDEKAKEEQNGDSMLLVAMNPHKKLIYVAAVFQITVKLPHQPYEIPIMVG